VADVVVVLLYLRDITSISWNYICFSYNWSLKALFFRKRFTFVYMSL